MSEQTQELAGYGTHLRQSRDGLVEEMELLEARLTESRRIVGQRELEVEALQSQNAELLARATKEMLDHETTKARLAIYVSQEITQDEYKGALRDYKAQVAKLEAELRHEKIAHIHPLHELQFELDNAREQVAKLNSFIKEAIDADDYGPEDWESWNNRAKELTNLK